MKTSDIVKGILFSALMVVLAMIGGAVDYRDATHFDRPDTPRQTLQPDTAETAFSIIRHVHQNEQRKAQ